MDKPKIIVISLIKNEDLYIKQVLNNVTDFADEIMVLDNMSTDNTYDIVEGMAKDNDKIKLQKIQSFKQSGAFTRPYFTTNTWFLSVDGDELYDKTGLQRMRAEILDGKFEDRWAISGYFLNCIEVDFDKNMAKGYMSPPSRPCIRLYNLKALRKWAQRKHRFHGGKPIFNKGYSLKSRYSMHKHLSWDESYLRFIHLCFIKRSSTDDSICRVNPTEIKLGRKVNSKYKKEIYKVGDIVDIDIKGFHEQV